jgi:Membrane bound beta barrel domain (DUF5777)
MKKNSLVFVFFMLSMVAFGQEPDVDNLLNDLDKIAPNTPQYVVATFKSTRIINGQSVETIAKKHLDFRISHRFGTINSGYKNLWGLDESRIRLGFEYGITDNLMVGVGRSSYLKEYDYFLKMKALRQKTGSWTHPVSITLAAGASTNTMDTRLPTVFNNNLERQSYWGQVLVARKFGERISIQVSPTVVHRNKTETLLDANTLYAAGIAGRIKLNKRTTFNAEYFYVANELISSELLRDSQYKNNLSLGFDIDTGGHVFQLHVSNSRGMVEKQFIGDTVDSWLNGGLYYGFNISRVFSFDKAAKQTHK